MAEMGIDVLQLDVTKEEEWDSAVDHIQQNSKQLWGLVNNAGTLPIRSIREFQIM